MIGKNIRQLRQEKHVRQETLAEALGVSGQAVSKWETGASEPDIALLPKLASYFGVSIDELFELPREEHMERIGNMLWHERRIRPETFARTAAYLEELIRNDTEDAQALGMLAALYCHRASGDREIAAWYAERALEADPADENDVWPTLLEARGGLCGDEWFDNHFGAIRAIKDFLEKHPGDRTALVFLVPNLIADHRFGEAEEAIAQLRGDYCGLCYGGDLAFARGDREKARMLWEQAARDFPQRWQAQDNLGQGYRKLGLLHEALEAFEKSFTMQQAPRYTDGLFARAQVHEQLGDYEGAIEDSRRIIECLREDYGTVDGEEVDERLREIERLRQLAGRA